MLSFERMDDAALVWIGKLCAKSNDVGGSLVCLSCSFGGALLRGTKPPIDWIDTPDDDMSQFNSR